MINNPGACVLSAPHHLQDGRPVAIKCSMPDLQGAIWVLLRLAGLGWTSP